MKVGLNKSLVFLFLHWAAPARAGQELPVFKLALKDHRFIPAQLVVPSGKKFKLIVSNEDAAPAEFESFVLHREQVVVAKGQAVVFLGPLKTGRYELIDDFHPKTRGVLVVGPAAGDSK